MVFIEASLAGQVLDGKNFRFLSELFQILFRDLTGGFRLEFGCALVIVNGPRQKSALSYSANSLSGMVLQVEEWSVPDAPRYTLG